MDIEEAVLSVYERIMGLIDAQWPAIPEAQRVEIAYENLDRAPVQELERLYASLGLPGFDTVRPRFEAYLKSVEGFEKNRFDYSDRSAQLVESRLGDYLARGGYQRPGSKVA